jgi:hypothetical protein
MNPGARSFAFLVTQLMDGHCPAQDAPGLQQQLQVAILDAHKQLST